MLRDQHRYLEAASHLEQAIALVPERAKYHFYLGEVRRATGDFAGALTAFNRTIELSLDDSTTRLSVSAELNVEASPKSELSEVHLEARYYHSDLLVRNQQLSQARTGFADLLARNPDHIQGGLGLGGLLIRLGEPTAAIPVLEHVAGTDPHNPAPHYLLAQAYAESDRPADMRRAQGRFQQLSAAERHLNQGNIYIRQGAWDKAIDSLKRALASDSTSVEIRLRLATVYAQQKRFADARAALAQILARNPDHRDAYIMLGDLYLHEGMSKEAATHFVHSLAIDPDSFAGAYGLGRARFKSGDFAGAVAALRQALARNPDHRDAHYALGLAYIRQANYRDAHTHFARSTALDPDHAESHYGLALILMQQGQREQARQALQKVLALAPDHQRARAKLSELDDSAELAEVQGP
ncbi:MAG: tetratricopeptide repeat protein [Gemmatimonadetes bacterium]|nr:tetratricopeptide repeat protein [Gemmatimonadota bacterium]